MSRWERVVYVALMVASFGALAAFLAFWFEPGHLPTNVPGRLHFLDAMIFGLLTLVFAHRLFMDAMTWTLAASIRRPGPTPIPPAGLDVAFITTFVPSSESIELLQATLPAMVAADYPHDTWVLDEGGDPDVQAYCESIGVRYFSRNGFEDYNTLDGSFAAKTKGGNHNSWYDAYGHTYDIVAQIDTDFIPNRAFLTRTLGYFNDERVGFVGTPQVYGNKHASVVARGAAQQLYLFYGALMRGLSGQKMCSMIGANHVVRVRALADIEYYAGHLTEDLLTGMRLHSRGWTSCYVPEALAIGEGPATWQAYFNQQMRWAFGCMDVLKSHTRGLARTMSLRQRVTYLALQQHYFNGVASLLGVILLCGYFLAGVHPARVDLLQMILWYSPLLILRQLFTLWLQRFNPPLESERGLLLHGRWVAVAVWPVYLLAFFGVVRGKRLQFKVTPKGGRSTVDRTPNSMIYPHVLLGAVTGACLVVGVLAHRTALAMVFWASLNSVLMLTFAAAVVLRPAFADLRSWVRTVPSRRRRGLRGRHHLPTPSVVFELSSREAAAEPAFTSG